MELIFSQYHDYIRDVINPLLPNARFDTFVNSSLNLFSRGQLVGSKYDYTQRPEASYIHFTSVTGLLEIIRSKKIRVSDFNCFSDDHELEFANQNFSKPSTNYPDLKSKLFAFSLCENTPDNLKNEYMWENYACKHRGVCIEFKLHNDPNVIDYFHFGKVIYSPDSEIQELLELKNRHDLYHKRVIDNLDTLLISISSMYKKAMEFSIENEIRLLAFDQYHNKGFENPNLPIQYRFNADKMITESFLELELENHAKKNLPIFSIEKIHTGKDLYPKQLGEEFLIDIIRNAFLNAFGREINFTHHYYGY